MIFGSEAGNGKGATAHDPPPALPYKKQNNYMRRGKLASNKNKSRAVSFKCISNSSG
jgi:hypothetical protein